MPSPKTQPQAALIQEMKQLASQFAVLEEVGRKTARGSR